MKIKYNENEDYCIYLAGFEVGKKFLFDVIHSESIHFNNELVSNNINVLSYMYHYETKTIVQLHKYLSSLKPKLTNVYILKTNFIEAILSHINTIVDDDEAYDFGIYDYEYYIDLYLKSHYFVLNFLNINNISYKEKEIFLLPKGIIDVKELFKEEIEQYDIKTYNDHYEKFGENLTIIERADLLEKNYLNRFGVSLKLNLEDLIKSYNIMETQLKLKYGL